MHFYQVTHSWDFAVWLWHELMYGTVSGHTWLKNVRDGFIENIRPPPPAYSANMPQQAQMELYARPFRAGLQAGAASVMCSYNRLNNTPACENEALYNALEGLDRTAADEFGSDYNYFVMSDWGVAVDNGTRAELAGLHVEMPTKLRTSHAIDAVVGPNATLLDQKVLQILKVMSKHGRLGDGPGGARNFPSPEHNVWRNVTTPEHKEVARQAAADGLVLLRNRDDLLPLSISLSPQSQSGGSRDRGLASAHSVVKNLEMAPEAENSEAFYVVNLEKTIDAAPHLRLDLFGCSDGALTSASAGSGQVTPSYSTSVEDGIRSALAVLSEETADQETSYRSIGLRLHDQEQVLLRTELVDLKSGTTQESEKRGAGATDVVSVACVHSVDTPDEEDYERSLPLAPFDFQKLRKRHAGSEDVASHRVVALISAAGVFTVTPELQSEPDALLVGFFAGEQAGMAMGNVLFGISSPGGRLPVTLPTQQNRIEFRPEQYPGVEAYSAGSNDARCSPAESPQVANAQAFAVDAQANAQDFPCGRDKHGNSYASSQIPAPNDVRGDQVFYSEDLAIGYRWYEKHNVKPAFPFGFGLSYYGDVAISNFVANVGMVSKHVARGESATRKLESADQDSKPKLQVSFCARSSGADPRRSATAVVQLYVQHTGRPFKELVGFRKIHVSGGAQGQCDRAVVRATHKVTSFDPWPLQLWSAGKQAYEDSLDPRIFIGHDLERISEIHIR